MKQSHFKQPERINPDRLHEELREALGEIYVSSDTGVTLSKEDRTPHVLVRVTDEATEADITTVESVLAAHKHDVLSSGQQRVKDRADAHERFKAADLKALRAKPKAERDEAILNLLEDIQLMMRGSD